MCEFHFSPRTIFSLIELGIDSAHHGKIISSAEYESRFEKEYGFLRPVIKEVVEHYLDCSNPHCGFARIRCPALSILP